MVGRFSAFDVLVHRPHVAARVPECNFCASYADVRDVTGWQPAVRPMFTPQRRAVRAPPGRHVGLAFLGGMLVDSSSVEELGQDRPLVRRLDRDPARRYGPNLTTVTAAAASVTAREDRQAKAVRPPGRKMLEQRAGIGPLTVKVRAGAS